jgi:hypothetical protein
LTKNKENDFTTLINAVDMMNDTNFKDNVLAVGDVHVNNIDYPRDDNSIKTSFHSDGQLVNAEVVSSDDHVNDGRDVC